MYRSKTHGYLVVMNRIEEKDGSVAQSRRPTIWTLWMTDIPVMQTNAWRYDAHEFYDDFELLTETQREEELSKLTIDQLFLLEEQLARGQKN